MTTTIYNYKENKIHKVTRRDYIVYGDNGEWLVHTKTLKEAKAQLDENKKEEK